MTAKVFISYRRDDSKYQARMIHAAFCQVIPRHHVFMDVDTIMPGANFRQIIQGWVNQCEVLLALIGPGWVDAGEPKANRRRLDNPSDFVRVEIREALTRGISVVPVLLDGTPMPNIDQLPNDLKELVDRQAEFVEYRTFDSDVAQLIRKLGLAAPDPQEDAKGLLSKGAKWSGAQAERYQQGVLLRREIPRERHADLGPRDPVKILAVGDRTRMPELVPVRYQRMLTSPFSFLRGAAAVMAQDLKNEPSAGIAVQACGDCQLMNFGAFSTPEGMIYFDINSFDETLPGVDFTVDLKRLAASVAVAALATKVPTKRVRAAAATTVAAYRRRMGALAKLSPLEIWHSKIDLVEEISQFEDRKLRKRFNAVVKKAAKTAEHDDNVLQIVGGTRIADKPPLIYHPEPTVDTRQRFDANEIFASYKKSLPSDSRRIFEQYTLRDTAFKVTGVASVGTFCTVNLFTSRDGAPLVLQLSEARTSVLECLGPKFDGHPGQRVADGQRILQATGDIFLGWADEPVSGRHFYVRQLKNHWLGSLPEFANNVFEDYGQLCAKALACAHARSADPAVIAGYVGEDDAFDDALASFAMVYAARTQEDYDWLVKAARRGTAEPAKRR
jgi:uncharacterized protein (DUF2252 family)